MFLHLPVLEHYRTWWTDNGKAVHIKKAVYIKKAVLLLMLCICKAVSTSEYFRIRALLLLGCIFDGIIKD
jgi:hypothetical protein